MPWYPDSISSIVNYRHFFPRRKPGRITNDFDLSFEWNYQSYLGLVEQWGLEKDYDALLKESRDRLTDDLYAKLSECEVKEQIEWDLENPDMEEEAVFDADREDRAKREDCDNPTGKGLYDIPAWYQPACFNKPEDYGIYITRWGVVSAAESITANGSAKIPTRDALVSALALLWWHELTHAWIEDMSSIIMSLTGHDRYALVTRAHNGYIYMEEALCNSSAYGNLASVLDENSNKLEILDSVEKMFRREPKGYRDFAKYDCWVDEIGSFFQNIYVLLHNIYGFEKFSCYHAVSTFFDTALIVENEVFVIKDRRRTHCLGYGGYGHSHRNYPATSMYHADPLQKLGGELYYQHSLYGTHVV